MATLRITPPNTGTAWAPLVSPMSPPGSSAGAESDSLSARCRFLASRLGGSAVHDDAHFDSGSGPSSSNNSAPPSPHHSSPAPSPGRSPRVGGGSSLSNPPPSFPLSPRSSLLGFDALPQHVLDEIREEDDGGEATPKGEPQVDMTSTWAPPRLAVAGQATGSQQYHQVPDLVSPGTVAKPLPGSDADVGERVPPSPTRSFGTASRTASSGSMGSGRRPSFASTMLLDLQHDDDDTDMEEATIEEQENELRQLLKDGATWLGVDLWLVDGDVLVSIFFLPPAGCDCG